MTNSIIFSSADADKKRSEVLDQVIVRRTVANVKPFAHHVLFRICDATRVGFKYNDVIVHAAQQLQQINGDFGKYIKYFQNKRAFELLHGYGVQHFRDNEVLREAFLIIEIGRKVEPAVGRYEMHLLSVFRAACVVIFEREQVAGTVGTVFQLDVRIPVQESPALFPPRAAETVFVNQRHSVVHVVWIAANVDQRLDESAWTLG